MHEPHLRLGQLQDLFVDACQCWNPHRAIVNSLHDFQQSFPFPSHLPSLSLSDKMQSGVSGRLAHG
ncbi:hypothetical protein Scep_007084 [Stephania cephalantha]|uniref:Uncharacterized protein n=1 Tax=Stephania cephalantha TaxID=152367 RepID=A0AAP0PLF8_9MAGN